MTSDLDRFTIHATPALMTELLVRRYDDTQALTDYAIEHGVELPEGHTPQWEITPVFDDEGNELGLYWLDPSEYAHED